MPERRPNQAATSKPHVLVTGITGFIGSAMATHLLQAGYMVHGTYRKASASKLLDSHTSNNNLKTFPCDLLDKRSYDEAATGCKFCVHAASPHKTDFASADDALTPCVVGTQNVLTACRKAGVRKVVMLSCYTALTSGGVGRPVDERDWNTRSSVRMLPGDFAKAEAERAAWQFHSAVADTGGPQIVTVNAAVVWGPSAVQGLNASKELLVRMAAGEMPGVIDLALPIVHVTDVVSCMVTLMEADAAEGRYVCSADEPLVHVRQIVRVMREKGLKPATLNLSSGVMSRFIRLSSHIVPGGTAGQFVRCHVGNPVRLSNRKIVEQFDVQFRDALTTLSETIDELLEKGFITPHVEPPPFDASKLQSLL